MKLSKIRMVKVKSRSPRNGRHRPERTSICTFGLGAFIGLGLYLCYAVYSGQDFPWLSQYYDEYDYEVDDVGSSSSRNETGYIETGPEVKVRVQEQGVNFSVVCVVLSTMKSLRSTHYLGRVGGDSGWGYHCTHLMAAGFRDRGLTNWGIPPVNNLSSIYNAYGSNVSWFVIVPETTYVYMKNLQRFLGQYNHSEAYQIGHALKDRNLTFINSAAGYVLSNEAVRRVVQASGQNRGNCQRADNLRHNYKMPAVFSSCLSSLLGVEIKDTRDEEGRLRFVPGPILNMITKQGNRFVENMRRYAPNGQPLVPIRQGMNCCSDDVIMFGVGRNSKLLVSLEYHLYQLYAYGLWGGTTTTT